MSQDMRREFASRDELIDYLKQQFPQAAARSPQVSEIRGGRRAAEARLRAGRYGTDYERTRNRLDGQVSRLSPYIRYGVLGLNEVREYALSHAEKRFEAEKFINELGWRDYFQRVYRETGDDIWEDMEDYKTGFPAHSYRQDLPDDIRQGQTEVRFIDDSIHELLETGYLHNHQRMWLAAYVVHWRRVCWQAGARWFLEHLLDGDPASNNLSWQWVASTFSTKPYYYNLENVLQFSGARYRGAASDFGHEDFEGTYEQIARRLFPYVDMSDARSDFKKGRR